MCTQVSLVYTLSSFHITIHCFHAEGDLISRVPTKGLIPDPAPQETRLTTKGPREDPSPGLNLPTITEPKRRD